MSQTFLLSVVKIASQIVEIWNENSINVHASVSDQSILKMTNEGKKGKLCCSANSAKFQLKFGGENVANQSVL